MDKNIVRHIHTNKPELSDEQLARLQALADLPDENINTDDIPEMTDWSKATRGAVVNHSDLDTDVATWLSQQNADTKKRINTVLRQFMAMQA